MTFMALRDQIAVQFNEKQVYVNYSTGAIVSVQLIDSLLLSASAEEKQKRADDVAAFVVNHCVRAILPGSGYAGVSAADRVGGALWTVFEPLCSPRDPSRYEIR